MQSCCDLFSIFHFTVNSTDTSANLNSEPIYDSIFVEKNAAYESNIQIVTHENVAYEKHASISGAGPNSVLTCYTHKQPDEVVVYI